MSTLKKTAAGTVLGGAMLVAGGLNLAHAAPPAPEAQTIGDGKINVVLTAANGEQIGTLQDVSIANAVTLVNSICPISGITDVTLGALDANGTAVTQTCGGMGGLSFTFDQNGPVNAPGQNGNRGNSQYAPGQNRNTETTPPSATPSTPPGQMGQQNG